MSRKIVSLSILAVIYLLIVWIGLSKLGDFSISDRIVLTSIIAFFAFGKFFKDIYEIEVEISKKREAEKGKQLMLFDLGMS